MDNKKVNATMCRRRQVVSACLLMLLCWSVWGNESDNKASAVCVAEEEQDITVKLVDVEEWRLTQQGTNWYFTSIEGRTKSVTFGYPTCMMPSLTPTELRGDVLISSNVGLQEGSVYYRVQVRVVTRERDYVAVFWKMRQKGNGKAEAEAASEDHKTPNGKE